MPQDFSPWSLMALQQQMEEQQGGGGAAPYSPLAPQGMLAMNQPTAGGAPQPVAMPSPANAPVRKMAVVPDMSKQAPRQAGQYGPATPDSAGFIDAFKQTMQQRAADQADARKQMADAQAKDFSGIQNVDFSPLTAMVDGWTGSKFSQNYVPPQDKAMNDAKIAKLRDAVNAGTNQQANDQLGFLKYQSEERSRLDANDAKKQQAAMMAAMMQGRLGQGNSRVEQRDEGLHNANIGNINKDPELVGLTNTANNLNNAIMLFQKGGATPNEFEELQQAVRSNLGIKGTSGVGERDATKLKSLGLDADRVNQFLSGSPQSIMESSPEFANQIINLANMELQNKSRAANQRIDQLSAGHGRFYGASGHEALSEDYNNTISGARGRIKSPPVAPENPQAQAITPAGVGASASQDPLAAKRARLAELQAKAGQG